jgi:hypothetical protein
MKLQNSYFSKHLKVFLHGQTKKMVIITKKGSRIKIKIMQTDAFSQKPIYSA